MQTLQGNLIGLNTCQSVRISGLAAAGKRPGAAKVLWREAGDARTADARAECDVDYEATAKSWMEATLTALTVSSSPAETGSRRREEAEVAADVMKQTTVMSAQPNPPRHLGGYEPTVHGRDPGGIKAAFSRSNPFPARLLANHILTGEGSGKEVRHFALGQK